jgi:PPOX class probable F420-dependent enzyme
MRALVDRAQVACLATIDEHGAAHLVPICFVRAGDELYTAVDQKPKRSRDLKRLANLRRDPRASVLVDHYDDDWSRLWWVRLDGTARILEQGAEFERVLELLAHKYAQYAAEPPRGPVIAMLVREWRGWRAR